MTFSDEQSRIQYHLGFHDAYYGNKYKGHNLMHLNYAYSKGWNKYKEDYLVTDICFTYNGVTINV